jgi:hypothetical protein
MFYRQRIRRSCHVLSVPAADKYALVVELEDIAGYKRASQLNLH